MKGCLIDFKILHSDTAYYIFFFYINYLFKSAFKAKNLSFII